MEYIVATPDNMNLLMQIRLEMLRSVNRLPLDYAFSDKLIAYSKAYFENPNQTTILAIEDNMAVACATLCYIEMMPTFAHPTGKRAHLMNVYTKEAFRRQGIAAEMLHKLIREARAKGVTEISLDATESGRPLYEKLGFQQSEECMVLNLFCEN